MDEENLIEIRRTRTSTARVATTPIMAVMGSGRFPWAAATVITPVIVPGLAANRINGVKEVDREFSGEPLAGLSWADLSMLAPIQTRIPPPAQENASRDMPNIFRIDVPARAAINRMMPIVVTALIAAFCFSRFGMLPTLLAKNSAHIKGFTRARIVTTACICSFISDDLGRALRVCVYEGGYIIVLGTVLDCLIKGLVSSFSILD